MSSTKTRVFTILFHGFDQILEWTSYITQLMNDGGVRPVKRVFVNIPAYNTIDEMLVKSPSAC